MRRCIPCRCFRILFEVARCSYVAYPVKSCHKKVILSKELDSESFSNFPKGTQEVKHRARIQIKARLIPPSF